MVRLDSFRQAHTETDVDREYFFTKDQMDMYRGLYQQFFNGLLK